MKGIEEKVIVLEGTVKTHGERISKVEVNLDALGEETSKRCRDHDKEAEAMRFAIGALQTACKDNADHIATMVRNTNTLALLVLVTVFGAILKLVIK